ncbi:very low-density lipoprotein receptor-like [Penaeus chinensis]|uniref:very low-density lipoprotein receptor-like n=1 Tax=Penaeus chinensis TaxID=139456 RepID=UPI001FB78EDE|nr:very low-density lipoprotein receptor-like [Penaeus chinensis]
MARVRVVAFISLILACTTRAAAAEASDSEAAKHHSPRPVGTPRNADRSRQHFILVMNGKSKYKKENLILQVNQHMGAGRRFPKKLDRAPPDPECPEGSWFCPGTTVCVSEDQKCDGTEDCPDGSDEASCNYATTPEPILCPVGWLYTCIGNHCVCDTTQCANGFLLCSNETRCIRTTQICDGLAHCTDGSDEENCTVECSDGHVRCGNTAQCILKDSVCDGYSHCPDNSDEENCDPCPESRPYKCNASSKCIKELFLCDGYADCPNNDDEANATCATCPSAKPVRCPSGECISEAWLCDLAAECKDGWDESNCTVCPAMTPFRCNVTGKCMPLVWVCDGESDCSTTQEEDDSDEASCDPCPDFKPNRCADGSACFPDNWRCNEVSDCADGSDERFC